MKKLLISAVFVLAFNLANAQIYRQYTIFIWSFTRYIQWPEAYNKGDFEILVLGDSPIMDELKILAQQKKVGERNITVTKIASPADIKKCNVLFIPADNPAKLSDILKKVDTQSVLVVTEKAGLGAQGSCINFIIKDGKLAFELNQAAVNRQNLKVSNELTRLGIMI